MFKSEIFSTLKLNLYMYFYMNIFSDKANIKSYYKTF